MANESPSRRTVTVTVSLIVCLILGLIIGFSLYFSLHSTPEPVVQPDEPAERSAAVGNCIPEVGVGVNRQECLQRGYVAEPSI